MSEYQNAVIESAKIEIEDHGLLTVWLGLDYGEGRLWAEDDPWVECADCGREAVKYVIGKGQ